MKNLEITSCNSMQGTATLNLNEMLRIVSKIKVICLLFIYQIEMTFTCYSSPKAAFGAANNTVKGTSRKLD